MSCRILIAYPGKSANNDLLQIEMRAHQGLHQNLSSFPGKKRSDLTECLQEESACLHYVAKTLSSVTPSLLAFCMGEMVELSIDKFSSRS